VVAAPADPDVGPRDELSGATIVTIADDGSDRQVVPIPDDLEVVQARWAPDGSTIALTIERPTGLDIVILDGSDVRELTSGSGGADSDDRDPAWSPDGSRIAFASDRSGTFEIHVGPIAGGDAEQLTRTEPSRASCSPAWGATDMSVPEPMPSPPLEATLALERGWLGGGRYQTDPFDPPFEVTMPEAWQAWQIAPDGVWVRGFTDSTNSELQVGRITVAHPDGCLDSPTQLAPDSSRALVEWLTAHPAVEVGTPLPVAVGGAPGIQVDVTGGPPLECNDIGPRIFLLDLASGRLFVRPEETVRLIAVDVDETLVLLVPRSSAQGEFELDPERLEQNVQPIIDSIVFESG
jgi:hypothetical protein